MSTELPPGMSEGEVRRMLADNHRRLVEERRSLVRAIKTSQARVEEIDSQLNDIEASVELLNQH